MAETVILYVDDEEGDVLLMQLHMADRNIDMDAAYSAKQGINMFNPSRHALVVLDWNLSDGTGIKVARHIREQSSETPIVFLSGLYTEDRLNEAQSYAPLACLEKSISMEYMDAIARLVLDMREEINEEKRQSN